jgi:hypothetical protein
MDVLALRDHSLNGNWIKFPIRALADEDLRAVREKLRRATFIGFHMRNLRADDRVIALA